jgi:Concanavalin A-like lectin/glucanases superfamily
MRTKVVGVVVCVVLLVATLPVLVTAPVKADPIKGLIGYWSFNEGAGTVAHDDSGFGNDGSLANAPIWTKGINGSGLEITDYEYVGDIPSSCDDSITTEFTITAWVKWYGLPSYDHGSYFFDARGNPYAGTGFLLYISFQRTVGFWLNDVDMASNMFSKHTVPLNTWTFVAATFDSALNLGKIYINGDLDNTDLITKEYLSNGDSPVIGTNHWAPGDGNWAPINGVEDEVRLFNRALSAQEIYALYKQDFNMLDASIDIAPGVYPNVINPSNPGKLGVAILSTDQFNADDVDPDSIVFLGADPLLYTMEDVDKDGDIDLLLHFSIPDLDFDLVVDENLQHYAILQGLLKKGTPFEGRDSVVIIGPLMQTLWMVLQKVIALYTMMMAGFNS